MSRSTGIASCQKKRHEYIVIFCMAFMNSCFIVWVHGDVVNADTLMTFIQFRSIGSISR
ncbi:hypothetical protein D3C87_1434060 [compost metagenome]